jgi:hypothetical protein
MAMNPHHRAAFEREMAAADSMRKAGQLGAAFRHLERAHVLGQAFVGPHVRSHLRMLGIEVRRRDARAAWGQAMRVLLGAIGSAVGSVPIGNTGGTDVSMFRPMPIEPELCELMDERARPG